MQQVLLSGDALQGIGSSLVPHALMSQLPQRVCLGRIEPVARCMAPSLASYIKSFGEVNIPESVDWYTKAAASLARMYLNDRYGCCVIAGKAHLLGIWSANDSDSGGTIIANDQEIYQQYQGICGPGDRGCLITNVLDTMKGRGFIAGGKTYKIDGYVSCDWRSRELISIGLALFGGMTIGFNLPKAWTQSSIWDLTNSPIVGGHDVTGAGCGKPKIVGVTDEGVVISSWGRLYLWKWAAFNSTRYITEAYFVVSNVWTGADNMAPSGVDLTTLRADLAKIGQGQLPPLPNPDVPPPEPVPTPPPTPGPPNIDPKWLWDVIMKIIQWLMSQHPEPQKFNELKAIINDPSLISVEEQRELLKQAGIDPHAGE